MKTISNDRMHSFIEAILNQTSQALHERSEDLLKSWRENIEEAQDNEKGLPPLKIGIGATIDLEADTVSTEIRFVVTYKSKISEPLPDPNQPEIPGFGAMEISVGGRLRGGIRKDASGKIHALNKKGSPV